MLKLFLVLNFVTFIASKPLEGGAITVTTTKCPDLSEIYIGLVELVKDLSAYTPVVNSSNPSNSSHKVLITGGHPNRLGQKTTIIDTENDDFNCTLPTEFPFEMKCRYPNYLTVDQLHRMVASGSEYLKNVYVTIINPDIEIRHIECSGSTPDTCTVRPIALSIGNNRSFHIAFTISDALADSLCE